jgi:polyhydroxybutyrate depolymerase
LPSTGTNVDDVGFLNAVLDQMLRSYAVDSTRLYMTGFSNGAWMTFRMGCDFAGRFAALGPLSGSWKYGRDGRCDHGGCDGRSIPGTEPPSAEAKANCVPTQPLPVMFFRGTREAALTDRALTDPQVPVFWSRFNGCQTTARVDTVRRNGDLIIRERYPACAQSAEVIVMSVVGNSHQWHASATDELWDFFKRFRRAATGQVVLSGMAPDSAVAGLRLYPNPGATFFTLAFSLSYPQPLTVELLDLTGRQLQVVSERMMAAGPQRLPLVIPPLATGVYLVRVRTPTRQQTLRISLL